MRAGKSEVRSRRSTRKMENQNMRSSKAVDKIGFAVLVMLTLGAGAQAADITVLASNGVKAVLT